MNIEFTTDNLKVFATEKGQSGYINTQSIEALLMLAILEKLEEIRCSIVDVESAVNPR